MKYFDGWLVDESGRVRFVCFIPSKYPLFQEFSRKGETISFADVTVQRNKIGKFMEVIIQKSTALLKSPQKIKVDTHLDAQPSVPKTIRLEEIVLQVPGQIVDVKAKVLDMSAISKAFTNNVSVRKVGIADEATAMIITLWGEAAEQVRVGLSYEFRLSVKFDSGEYTLYTPKNGSRMVRIDPLGDVVAGNFNLSQADTAMSQAEIVGVSNFTSHFLCRGCKTGKAVQIETKPAFARCQSCRTISQTDHCGHQVTALLTLQSSSVLNIQLTADSAVMESICNAPIELIDEFSLFQTPPLGLFYNKAKRIVSVSRCEKPSSPKQPPKAMRFLTFACEKSNSPQHDDSTDNKIEGLETPVR